MNMHNFALESVSSTQQEHYYHLILFVILFKFCKQNPSFSTFSFRLDRSLSKEATSLEIWNHEAISNLNYLNRVAHEARSHFRSRRFSLPLYRFQPKYHTKTALIQILIFLRIKVRIHVQNHCYSQLLYPKLCKQCRFPPFNETLNSPRNHNTEH